MRGALMLSGLLALTGCGSSAANETSGSGATGGGGSGATGGLGSGGTGALAGGGAAGTAGGAGQAGSFGSGGAQSGYPAGPYGNQLGDVLPNLEVEGYIRTDATGLAYQSQFQTATFADIRQSTKKTHALIHVSGFT